MEELTTAEFAEATGISARTIRNMIRRKAIKARLVRTDQTVQKGVYKIPITEMSKVKDWLKKNSQLPKTESLT